MEVECYVPCESPVPVPGQCCPVCPGEFRDVELGVVCLHGECGCV